MKSSIRVLVVDDHATMRRIIVNLLRKMGIVDCHEASDGPEALETLDRIKVDLVITDWNMPLMSGLELTRRLRARQDTAAVPIVMLTAHDTEEDVLAALHAGATNYMVKPFKGATFTERIGAILPSLGSPATPAAGGAGSIRWR
jgi:two-component system, chemotaxis family, chemotaxis protein CheY